jgi:histidinol-phosphate aminotransferase
MKQLARKEIFSVKSYIPGKPIEEVKREQGLKQVTKLASNENALGPSRRTVRASQKALLSLNRYPDGGCFYLKKALARRFGVGPENLVVGNGSDELIVLAARAFLKKRDEVIIAHPTFLIYEIASKVAGAKIRFVPLKDYRYDVKGMVRAMTRKTKLVFIANPDNPTGTYLTRKELDYLVSRTPKKTLLYVDEAYFEFARGLKDYPRTFSYLKKKRNVIISRSFSKIYSLAGLRIGYGIADKGIIDCLNRVREPFNVNSVAQAAALAAFEDRRHIQKTLSLVRRGKSFLYRELERMGLPYVPSATNFVLINTGCDSKRIFKALLKEGVIVREMSPWALDNCIRVTIGTAKENSVFIRALKKVIRK